MRCFEVIPEITVSGGKTIMDGKEISCAHLAYELYLQGADGLLLNNVDKTRQGVADMFRAVSEVSNRVFLPLRVSGAIYETAQLRIYINDGADRVYYNSNGIRCPQFINDSVKRLGGHHVGVAVDCKRNSDMDIYQVYAQNGTVSVGKAASLWINEVFQRGVQDVLINVLSDASTLEQDIRGFMNKLEKIKKPLFLRGGFDKPEQYISACNMGACGVVSTALCSKNAVEQVKNALAKQNINVR